MKHGLRWILCLLVLLALVAPVLAQDDTVTLVPFTDENFGVQGVIPEDWQGMGNGLYGRSPATNDITLLALQAVPASADQLLQSLLPQLLLTEAPESVATITAGWSSRSGYWPVTDFLSAITFFRGPCDTISPPWTPMGSVRSPACRTSPSRMRPCAACCAASPTRC